MDDSKFDPALNSGWCDTCAKRRYPTRRSAKQGHRRHNPGTTPRVYPCPLEGAEGFHVTTQSAEEVAEHRRLDSEAALAPGQHAQAMTAIGIIAASIRPPAAR
jgi:hypothetical protein